MARLDYKTHTEPFLLRLTSEQRDRLKKAAHSIGKNMSDFIRDAVMIHISNVEENIHHVEERSHKAFVPSTGGSKSAFRRGMESAARREITPQVVQEQQVVESTQQNPTVVVHTGGSQSDIADKLANHILSAPNTVEREVRSNRIVKLLQEIDGGQEIARALDEKIEARTPKRDLWSRITGR